MNAPVAHRALLGAALTAALFAAGINVAQSQNEPTPAYPAAEKHKPTTLPDRIALTNEADPSNSQSVTWRTDTTVKTAQAQIAKSTGGPGFKASATTVLATRNVQQTSSLGAETVFHTVRFTGLEPETKYLYRVGDGTNWGEWLEFETAAATYKPFSFVYLGDAQNDIQEHWSRLVRQAFKDAPEAKLTVHAGDLVDTSSNDGQWGEWFKANSFIPAMQNNIATPGNHEYSGTTLAPYWRTQFAFPDNGPTQGTAGGHRRAQGHRVLLGLPGRPVHLAELERLGRGLRAASGVPRGPAGLARERPAEQPEQVDGRDLPPPDVLHRRGA